jgi:lipopolysaccharide export system permease protein
MIKKLDKLIIKAFTGPFIATFFIALFVLMMQTIWKYIDDLVGKGLDFITIGEFVWYASASLLALSMPIAILISSIMTFGNLGESFELVAIKSAGISLLRFMRPIMWITLLLCGVTFIFANNVIPYANLKFISLYNDIYYKKPAFDLKEGVFFTHIPNYAIKVARKDPDGKTIYNVLIYEQNNSGQQDNVIIAEKGTMTVSLDKNFLEFNLQNGYRYQERGNITDTSTEFIRIKFSSFKKLLDLSVLQKQTTPDSIFKNNQRMLTAGSLYRNIDSLSIVYDSISKKIKSGANTYIHYAKVSDSTWKAVNKKTIKKSNTPITLIPDSLKSIIYDRTFSVASNMRSTIQFGYSELEAREKDIRSSQLEWHRKFSFSLACLVLFFIGAPLGSIIRKGGMGMPLVVAIIFFLIFHLLNMFGEKFVKEGLASPFVGMWLAVLVLTPVGIFLTYKALHDSQLFNVEFYYRFINRIKNRNRTKKKEDDFIA